MPNLNKAEVDKGQIRLLKNIQKNKKVYIENYSQEIRTCDSNFRTILKEMCKDKQFWVFGGKVYPVEPKAD